MLTTDKPRGRISAMWVEDKGSEKVQVDGPIGEKVRDAPLIDLASVFEVQSDEGGKSMVIVSFDKERNALARHDVDSFTEGIKLVSQLNRHIAKVWPDEWQAMLEAGTRGIAGKEPH